MFGGARVATGVQCRPESQLLGGRGGGNTSMQVQLAKCVIVPNIVGVDLKSEYDSPEREQREIPAPVWNSQGWKLPKISKESYEALSFPMFIEFS